MKTKRTKWTKPTSYVASATTPYGLVVAAGEGPTGEIALEHARIALHRIEHALAEQCKPITIFVRSKP